MPTYVQPWLRGLVMKIPIVFPGQRTVLGTQVRSKTQSGSPIILNFWTDPFPPVGKSSQVYTWSINQVNFIYGEGGDRKSQIFV